MKHNVNFDDGDLEYVMGQVKELINLVDRVLVTVKSFTNLKASIKLKVAGVSVASLEVKLSEGISSK